MHPITDAGPSHNTTSYPQEMKSSRFEVIMVNDAAFSYYDRLKKVKQFVNQHYSERIRLRDAARVAGLENKYFSKFFHEKTGICFKDWLTYIRMRHAIELLKAGDWAITELAMTVGYHNLRTFERAFKKSTGMTPQAFKSSTKPS